MKRREFVGALTGAGLAAATAGTALPHAALAPASSVVPFSLSVMLWSVFEKLPFEQRLEKVAEAGYRAVELVNEFKSWKTEDFSRARSKARELEMKFDATAGVWHTLADPADREPFLKSVRDFLPTMHELECRSLVLQSGNKVPGMSQEQMASACIETLKRAGELAAKNDIELLVENIDPLENSKYFITSSADGFEMIRAVNNPNVKFLYDFFHEQIACGSLISKLEKFIDLVGLVHVADVPGRHEPGTGEIYYPNIYRKLAELGYKRYVAMEFLPKGEPVAALRAAREMATQYGQIGSK